MRRGTLHRIEGHTSDTWLTSWAEDGVRELERMLAKHAAFADWIEGHGG